jgi:hypothetical protein
MTPRALYAEIKRVAEKRYRYTLLPKKLQQLKCLDTAANKVSLLRDICNCTGISINFRADKDFLFDNETEKVKSSIS